MASYRLVGSRENRERTEHKRYRDRVNYGRVTTPGLGVNGERILATRSTLGGRGWRLTCPTSERAAAAETLRRKREGGAQ